MVEERPAAINRMAGLRQPMVTGLTPKEVFGILRRHVLLIVVLTGLGFVIGGATWYLSKEYFPKYTASTYIEVLPPIEIDPMKITSVQVQKDLQYGHRLSLANLIKQQSTLQQLLARDNIKRTMWFVRKADEAKRIKDLDNYLGAYAHRDAGYIEVSMSCRKPDEAALIVNEMVDLFVSSQGGTKRAEIADKLTRLDDQRSRVQRELDAAERGLGEVRTAWGITDLARPAGYGYRQTIELELDDLSIQENGLALLVKQLQADIKNLEELATGPITVQVENIIENDPVLILLAQRIALLEAELASRLTKFGENHRIVLQWQELINEVKERRRIRREEIAEQTRQANFENAQDQLVVMQERLAEMEKLRVETAAKKRDLDMARVQFEQRLKIRDERIVMLDSIKEQIEKLKIVHDDPSTTKVQRVGLAPVPLEMVTSRKLWVHFPLGTGLGFLLGIGFSFLIEVLNDLVRTPRDVSRFLRIPLLSMIPDVVEDDQARGIDPCHIVRHAPYCLISESYRQLRTDLRLSGTAEPKILLVSSGSAGDGKTSVAVNLATTYVAENKKVLLIDANFRRPSLQTLFPKVGPQGLEAEHFDFGLSNVLIRQCRAQDAIRPSGVEGLDIMDAGPLPSNPADLLDSTQMKELLKEQRENYDYVVLDSPPVLLVSDSKVLAKIADATVLVFNAAATRRGAAQRTIGQLKEVNAQIVGCVLLAARIMKGGYFEEQFKSYRRYQKVQPATAAV